MGLAWQQALSGSGSSSIADFKPSYAGDMTDFSTQYPWAAGLIAVIGLAAFTALAVVAPELLLALAGAGEAGAGEAVPFFVDEIIDSPWEYPQHTLDWVARTFPDAWSAAGLD